MKLNISNEGVPLLKEVKKKNYFSTMRAIFRQLNQPRVKTSRRRILKEKNLKCEKCFLNCMDFLI